MSYLELLPAVDVKDGLKKTIEYFKEVICANGGNIDVNLPRKYASINKKL
jgi:hypothetical protein